MVSEKDIYISANIILEQHGDEALKVVNEIIANSAGGKVWPRIREAIKVLNNQEPDVIN